MCSIHRSCFFLTYSVARLLINFNSNYEWWCEGLVIRTPYERTCFVVISGEIDLLNSYYISSCNRFSPVSSQSESDTFGVNGGDWASAFTHPRGDDAGSSNAKVIKSELSP